MEFIIEFLSISSSNYMYDFLTFRWQRWHVRQWDSSVNHNRFSDAPGCGQVRRQPVTASTATPSPTTVVSTDFSATHLVIDVLSGDQQPGSNAQHAPSIATCNAAAAASGCRCRCGCRAN